MRYFLLTLSILLSSLFTPAAFADKAKSGKAKHKTEVEIQRREHLAQLLGLDTPTTARFTEVYARYTAEMHAAQQQNARIKPPKVDGKPRPLTDNEVRTNIERKFSLAQATLDIRRKYYAEYLKILSIRQIDRLYVLEKKSAEKLRELVRKKKKDDD